LIKLLPYFMFISSYTTFININIIQSNGDAQMSLKRELLDKAPNSVKDEPHFNALLDHIKQHDIGSKDHLKKFLEQEIGILERWLEDNKNRSETAVKSVRDKVVQLDVLKKCHQLSENFLF
jgi:hypothetical protein